MRSHHRLVSLVGLGGRHPHAGQLGLLESHDLLRAHLKHRLSLRGNKLSVFTGSLLLMLERGSRWGIVVGGPICPICRRRRVLIRFMRGGGATPTTSSSHSRRGCMGEPTRCSGSLLLLLLCSNKPSSLMVRLIISRSLSA